MTPRQAAFVREYLVDLNGAKAARRAGYSERVANREASRLLSNAVIASAISEAQAARAQATGVTAELVLRELARLAFGDARAIFNGAGELRRPEDWPDDLAAAIASVEVVTASRGEGVVEHVAKIKLWDKGRALELLARHLGMLNDKIKLEAGEGLAETLIKARKRRRGAE